MNKKINLSKSDKEKLWDLLKVWDKDILKRDNYLTLQNRFKLPLLTHELYFMHYENLDVLKQFKNHFIFKGGTAVQLFVPSNYQRGSIDLDFNTTNGNPSIIKNIIKKVNDFLSKSNLIIKVKGITFGNLEFVKEDFHSGTITYKRLLPTSFNQFAKIGHIFVQGRKYQFQFNFKHAWMPALKPINDQKIKYYIEEEFNLDYHPIINCASNNDLICDKLLTQTQLGGFGRERFKDVYDLIILFKTDYSEELINEKLELIAEKKSLKIKDMKGSIINSLDNLKGKVIEVQGLRAHVAIGGWDIIGNWEKEIANIKKIIQWM